MHHFNAIVIVSEFYGGMKLLASILQHKHYLKPFITQPQQKIENKKKIIIKILMLKLNFDAQWFDWSKAPH